MFILRVITDEKKIRNYEVGRGYDFIRRDDDDFENWVEHHYGKNLKQDYKEKIYGFVSSVEETRSFPLVEGDEYYMMTDSGSTFENLTRS